MQPIDGGKSFERIPTPHGDNHALWINQKIRTMINGNDGGANISASNGGSSWSIQSNQPSTVLPGKQWRINHLPTAYAEGSRISFRFLPVCC
ncbi:MAG: hypothetical protein R3B93_27195 [Bacteroidia bacterium]